MFRAALLTLVACAVTAEAQKPAAPSAAADAKALWQMTIANVNASAADVPESLYSYKPTPEVRSFGALVAHVAGSQKMFCAMALGEKVPDEADVEKTAKTKAAIVAALKESNSYCARAYSLSDEVLRGEVDVFGTKRSKLFALMMNAAHDDEHYGNIVTYMRLNRLVPPSSKPAK
jgi:uncharacterized damage-inducible protein DinB